MTDVATVLDGLKIVVMSPAMLPVNLVTALGRHITGGASTMDFIKSLFSWDTIKTAGRALLGFGKGFLSGVKGFFESLGKLIVDPTQFFKDLFTGIKNFPSNFWNTLKNAGNDPEAWGRLIGEMTGGVETGLAVGWVFKVGVPKLATKIGGYVGANHIKTPYCTAFQEHSTTALDTKNLVAQGEQIYRAGWWEYGSKAAEGQYWALENPIGRAGYSARYGIDYSLGKSPDWIIGGHVPIGTEVVTRTAEGGTGIEIVTNPNAVRLDYFYMP